MEHHSGLQLQLRSATERDLQRFDLCPPDTPLPAPGVASALSAEECTSLLRRHELAPRRVSSVRFASRPATTGLVPATGYPLMRLVGDDATASETVAATDDWEAIHTPNVLRRGTASKPDPPAAPTAERATLSSSYNPDGVLSVPGSAQGTWSSWATESEDEASDDGVPWSAELSRRGAAFIKSPRALAHEEESSEEAKPRTQIALALLPMEGEENVELDRVLTAEFALPGAAVGVASSVDKQLVTVEPAHAVQVYWKSLNVLSVTPVGGRWHGSTSYTVTIDASAVLRLADPVVFRFHTAPLRVQIFNRIAPDDPLRPVCRLVPNQRIDLDRLLAGLSLTSRPQGVTSYLLTSVTGSRSTHSFKVVSNSLEAVEIAPIGPLPPNSVVELQLAPGAYSMEGPNAQRETNFLSFSTYAPLSIVSRFPGYFQRITPGERWCINFSNDLCIEPGRLESLVSIVPAVPFELVVERGSRLCITPDTEAHTTYQVTLSAAISDIFGQQLSQADRFTFTTGDWPPFAGLLKGATGLWTNVGPRRSYQYQVTGMSSVRERIFTLPVNAFPDSFGDDEVDDDALASSSSSDEAELDAPPSPSNLSPSTLPPVTLQERQCEWILHHGTCCLDRTVSVASNGRAAQWRALDWSAHLPTAGRIAILVEPGESLAARIQGGGSSVRKLSLSCIVQSSAMCVSSFALAGTVHVVVSHLADGAPVVGATLREADGGRKLGVTSAQGLLTLSRITERCLMVVSPLNESDTCLYRVPSVRTRGALMDHTAFCALVDRTSYAAGDTIVVKIWARVRSPQALETLSLFAPYQQLDWSCTDVNGKVVVSGSSLFGRFSSADVVIVLPDAHDVRSAAPGPCVITFCCDVPTWNERNQFLGSCQVHVDGPLSEQQQPGALVAAPAPNTPHKSPSPLPGRRAPPVAVAGAASASATNRPAKLTCRVCVERPLMASCGAPLDEALTVATVTADRTGLGDCRLSGALVKWYVEASSVPLTVPATAWPGFVFGDHTLSTPVHPVTHTAGPLRAELNGAGFHRLALGWAGMDELRRPFQVRVTAVVEDLFERAVDDSCVFSLAPTVDPLVGVRLVRPWVLVGDRCEFDVLLVTFGSHECVAGTVKVTVVCGDTVEMHEVVNVRSNPHRLAFAPSRCGHHRVVVVGTSFRTSVPFFVGPQRAPMAPFDRPASMKRFRGALQKLLDPAQPDPLVELRKSPVVLLVAGRDHEGYAAPDKPLECLVVCRDMPLAHGLLVLLAPSTGTLLGMAHFRLHTGGAEEVTLAMSDRCFPAVVVRVLLLGVSLRGHPAWAEAERLVLVQRTSRALAVSLAGAGGVDQHASCPPDARDASVTVRVSHAITGVPVAGAEVVVFSYRGRGHAAPALLQDLYAPHQRRDHYAALCALPPTERQLLVHARDLLDVMGGAGAAGAGTALGARALAAQRALSEAPAEDHRDKDEQQASSSTTTTADSESVHASPALARSGEVPKVLFASVVPLLRATPDARVVHAAVQHGNFLSLSERVLAGNAQSGRFTVGESSGGFYFVIQRSASAVVVCLANKRFPTSLANDLVDELHQVATSFSHVSPAMLLAKIGRCNQLAETMLHDVRALPADAGHWDDSAEAAVALHGVPTTATPPPTAPARDGLFAESVATDAQGMATVKLEHLTPMRDGDARSLIAVAASADQFGVAEAVLQCRAPLAVVAHAPRFVRVGDSFTVMLEVVCDAATLQRERTVRVAASLAGASGVVFADRPSDECVRGFTLKLGGARVRETLALPMAAVAPAGEVQLHVVAERDDALRALHSVTVAVLWLPQALCTVRGGTFGAAQSAASGMRSPRSSSSNLLASRASSSGLTAAASDAAVVGARVEVRGTLRPDAGSLHVDVSRTQMLLLAPCVALLHASVADYAEALSSRALVSTSCYASLGLMGSMVPTKEALLTQMHADARLLLDLQGAMGGFGFWSRHSTSSNFISTHASHALWELSRIGVSEISQAALDRCRSFVDSASRAPVSSRRDVRARAYASYVGVKMGACVVEAAQAKRVAMEEDHSDLDTLGWLLASVCLSRTESEEPKRRLGNIRTFWGLLGDSPSRQRLEVLEALLWRLFEAFEARTAPSAGAPGSAISENDLDHSFDAFHSPSRAAAVALEAVVRASAELGKSAKATTIARRADELAAVVLSHRSSEGTWRTTHEMAFCARSLALYFASQETLMTAAAAPLEVRLWHGVPPKMSEVVGLASAAIPLSELRAASADGHDVAVAASGDGGAHMSYLLTLRAWHASAAVRPVRAGFRVLRALEAIDSDAHVRYDVASSTYTVALGARVLVALSFAPLQGGNHQVQLVDHICAGFELASERSIGAEVYGSKWRARVTWEDHSVVHRDQVQVFADALPGLVERRFSYVVHARHPGRYALPPAVVRELYRADRYGFSQGVYVVVQ